MTIVIFGGAGDLAHRKLLPALYNLRVDRLLPERCAIVGVGRKAMSDDNYRVWAREGVGQFSRRRVDDRAWQEFAGSIYFVEADLESPTAFPTLGARLDTIEHERGLSGDRIYYLAVPPQMFVPIVKQLGRARFVGPPDSKPLARLVVEKPIGHDLASAQAINAAIADVFDEPRIFRIDHYLGKETVQNILVLRFANSFLEPLFNHRFIDHVQITVAEEEGVGTRASYYERAGALRDMVQNHLLQMLCLVAMEPPTYVGDETVRNEKLKVLQALKPMSAADVDRDCAPGQYAAGLVDGVAVPPYTDDVADAGSHTETFVAIKAEVQNWRWAGVPFYLRTGKRMDRQSSEIVVVFKHPPHSMFPHSQGTSEPNRLHIQVQPDEGMRLQMTAKEPGPGGVRLRPVSLDLSYAAAFGRRSPDAYERLLMDVVQGNPTLFMRRDEVEAAWAWVEPILARWAETPIRPKRYPAGTSGPTTAAMLLERDGRSWQEADS
jgi:glucose-6-phosphate 1-dehydrogenase